MPIKQALEALAKTLKVSSLTTAHSLLNLLTLVFTKLDRTNYVIRKIQVLSTIYGNSLEHVIGDSQDTQTKYTNSVEDNGTVKITPNSTLLI